MGKFSKPRNRFQDSQATESMPQLIPQPTQETVPTEEEVIERTFREVSDAPHNDNAFIDFLVKNKFPILIGVCASVLVALLIVVGVLAFGGASDPYDGKILPNVHIAGVNVGGLTKSQAESVIRSATDETFTQQDMVVHFPDGSLHLSPADTGAQLDVKAAVKAAYDYGRSGSQAQKEAAYQNALNGSHYIALLPFLELDTEYIRQAVENYAAGYQSTATEPSWRLEGDMPVLTIPEDDADKPIPQILLITLGTPGISMNTEAICNMILDAYSLNHFRVDYETEDPSALPSFPDLQAIYDACYIEPVDASMNQQTYEPIPGSYGYDFDMAAAQSLLAGAEHGETISVPMRLITPGVEAESLLFQDVLGYCETPHNQNEKRNYNLMLVCQFLDGLILDPGEEFSYNDSVGERTAARGFKAAPAYSGTKLVDSIGGGVCQGSSTLYYAALLADMEIVFRINHGFPVSYIPMGLDATVNWGGPDLKFKNSSNYPVKLKAEVSDGLVKMWIMGTDERDYYVKLDYEITRYITPDEVIEEHDADSGYYDGQILQHGTPGYTVRSYKYRYNKQTNELISKDFVALSSYMTEDKIIVKIIGGEDETEPTDPSESTEPSTDETTSEPSAEAPSTEETTQPTTEATTPTTEATTPTTEATTPTTEATTPPTTQATQPPATDPPAPPPADQTE